MKKQKSHLFNCNKPEYLLCQPGDIPAIRPFGLCAHWARFGILTNCSQVNNLIINFFFSCRKKEL